LRRRERIDMNRENIEPTGQGKAEAFSSAAIARRRILLNGVGKGAAVWQRRYRFRLWQVRLC